MPSYHYGSSSYGGQRQRRRTPRGSRVLAVAALCILAGGIVFGIVKGVGLVRRWVHEVMDDPQATKTGESLIPGESTEDETDYSALIRSADAMALQYDYDGAIALLQEVEGYEKNEQLSAALTRLKAARSELARIDINKVCHLSVRSLIADPAAAFGSADKDTLAANYLTVAEFEAILEKLYEGGWVLVDIGDMAHPDANGFFVSGTILLPKDKKAFVLSVEDLVYYEANAGKGFADRLVIDEDGDPKCTMRQSGGKTVVGDLDVVPIVESFIKNHPDFSYKGARGIIALTGYDGILGYRTAPKYGDPSSKDYKPAYASINVELERTEARMVAARLKELGWRFASHSWGHINMAKAELSRIKDDTARWKEQVVPLIGSAEILFFDSGTDIGSWRAYSAENNAKFAYLKSEGFTYYCGVDLTTIPWVQLSTSAAYLRQGRVKVNGTQLTRYPERLAPFFDAAAVLDKARP
ncbi:MAG: polysaccharide deacetylase [Lachnospiraceae bacterium]|nr:polysaccharide deacetylase [Lachnospiraceae bacterium]